MVDSGEELTCDSYPSTSESMSTRLPINNQFQFRNHHQQVVLKKLLRLVKVWIYNDICFLTVHWHVLLFTGENFRLVSLYISIIYNTAAKQQISVKWDITIRYHLTTAQISEGIQIIVFCNWLCNYFIPYRGEKITRT